MDPFFGADYNPDSYGFVEEFQRRILGLLVRDRQWLQSYRQAIDARFFESVPMRDIAQLILSHFDTFQAPPDEVELAEALDSHLGAKRERLQAADAYLEVARAVLYDDLGCREHLTEKALRFAQHQAAKLAVIKSADLLRAEDYEGIEETMRKALAIGLDRQATGSDYAATFRIAVRQSFAELRRPVPTGLQQHDQRIGGGLGKGEMGIVLADTGLGKTLSMVEFGAGAVCAGKHAMHLSLEEPEWKLLDRYNRRFSGRTREEIRENADDVEARITEILRLTKGRLSYAYVEPGTSLQAIKALVHQRELEVGRAVDVVLLDYLDRVAPPRERKNGAEEMRELSDAVLAWIGHKGEEKALWTGSQITTEGIGAETVTHKHVANARAKNHPAAVIIGVSQTKKERETKPFPLVRFFYAKNRDYEHAVADRYAIDYARSRLVYAGLAPDEKEDAAK